MNKSYTFIHLPPRMLDFFTWCFCSPECRGPQIGESEPGLLCGRERGQHSLQLLRKGRQWVYRTCFRVRKTCFISPKSANIYRARVGCWLCEIDEKRDFRFFVERKVQLKVKDWLTLFAGLSRGPWIPGTSEELDSCQAMVFAVYSLMGGGTKIRKRVGTEVEERLQPTPDWGPWIPRTTEN